MKFITTRSIRSIPALHSNYFSPLLWCDKSWSRVRWLTNKKAWAKCSNNKKKKEKGLSKPEAPSQAHSCLNSHPAWFSLPKHGLMTGLILAVLALGRSCTWETLKSRLHSGAFPAFPWTTRWQFPISKRGSRYLLAPAQQLQNQAELRHICPCCSRSWGAVGDNGPGPASHLKGQQLCNHARQQKEFPQAPRGCWAPHTAPVHRRDPPHHALLTQNFTRKKAFWGPFPNSSFRPPFFSGNLS